MSNKTRQSVAVCLCLAAVTLFAYWGVLSAEFNNYDDAQYLTTNPAVQGGLSTSSIEWAFTSGYACNWHPLTWISHMLDWQLYGTNAGMHHLTGLIFHIANAILLFALLRWTTGSVWGSSFVAAIFALHPVHVESVAWVAERKDVLSTFFWLLTSLGYVAYARRPGWWRYFLVTFLFALGLMSKPMVVTLPAILMLMDVWPLNRVRFASPVSDGKGNSRSWIPENWQQLVLEKVPLLLMAAVSSWVTIQVQVGGGAAVMTQLTLIDRVGNALISYVRYVGKFIWPANLSVFYPYNNHWPIWQVACAALLILLLLVVAAFQVGKKPFLMAGWLWYFITLLPVIGLIQVGEQSMADRYMYIPSIGLSIMMVWSLSTLLRKIPYRQWMFGTIGMALLAGCVLGTVKQVGYWKNSVTLFSHALDVTQNNSVAHYNLGQAFSTLGKHEQSIEHYRKALLINPRKDSAHNNLGLALVNQGKVEEALQHYEAALGLNPNNDAALYNYGVSLVMVGRFDDALIEFQKVLGLLPNDPMSLYQIGRVLCLQEKLEEAHQYLSESLRIAPGQANVHYQLGMLLERQGKTDEAVPHFSEALKYKPNYFEPWAHLGLIAGMAGNYNDAIRCYREALKLQPDSVEILNNLAWILAANSDPAIRNGEEAVALARKASDLTGSKEPMLLGTLAAALAEAGRFSEAIATANKARELALAANQPEIARKNQELANLYQAGKAYHETPVKEASNKKMP